MRKHNTSILFFLLSTLFIHTYEAQQLPQFSQYGINSIVVNPAYAGSGDFFSVSLLNRNQWLGVNGGPKTQTVSINTSIENSNFGVGISAINDKLGYEKNTFIFSDISYTLNFGRKENHKFSFGIKAGANRFSLDQSLYEDPQNSNDSYLETISDKWHPLLGLGIYYRSDYFYLGLSVPKILDISTQTIADYKTDDRLNYYFNGGYLIEMNSNLQIKPSFLIKYVNGAPLAIDLNTMFVFNEKMWLGVNYRHQDAIGALAQFKIQSFLIGYAYEFTTSKLNTFSNGSHELLLTYRIKIRDCQCPDLYN